MHTQTTPNERMPVSALQLQRHDFASGGGRTFSVDTHRINAGMLLTRSSGRLDRARQLALIDDTDHVFFHFRLQGDTDCVLGEGRDARHHCVREGAGAVLYHPGGPSTLRHVGVLDGITISIDRRALDTQSDGLDPALERRLATGRVFLDATANMEMHGTALALAHAFGPPQPGAPYRLLRHPLWIGGQSCVLMALFLEQLGLLGGAEAARAAPDDLARLARARDLLLADLSSPPSVEALARASGLTILKLKRSFPKIFGRSIYDLFQHERMLEARRRLMNGAESVSTVAVDLGYSNLSHFAQAFRRQIGVNPSEVLKRRRLVTPTRSVTDGETSDAVE